MLELKKVSKFYYNKGVISAGFRKIDLKMDIGEFIAITGESGSGKSTLINVLSGLDSYEEGEMLVNNQKTSHYTRKEFEEYRKKYVSNIYQDFNLINSYTVYQNVELALTLNGYKKKEIKEKIANIIKKVGLSKYKNTKVSKLSGGQKQRVSIARALVKDSSIIIADEPTGNIDSKSAKSIMKLLSELSKERLVIVVTHNYEQVEEYATRRIKMHDGRIIEDSILKDVDKVGSVYSSRYKEINLLNKLQLSVRNTFNLIPKFLILMTIYLFITAAVVSSYTMFLRTQKVANETFQNQYFSDKTDKRIVIQNKDKTAFTDEQFSKIKSINNIENILKDDTMLDKEFILSSSNSNISYYGKMEEVSLLKNKILYGRMPENKNEIVVLLDKDDWRLREEMLEESLGHEYNFSNIYNSNDNIEEKFKIVGIATRSSGVNEYEDVMYVTEELLEEIRILENITYSKLSVLFQNSYKSTSQKVVPNEKVPRGYVYAPEELNYISPKEKAQGQKIEINIDNQFFKDSKTLEIKDTYDKANFKKLTGLEDFKTSNQMIYMNKDEYIELFNKGYFQSSIYIKDIDKVQDTLNKLNEMNLKTLYIKDFKVDMSKEYTLIQKVMSVGILCTLIIGVFFISYFLIKIVLKSRNVYYTTLRMLGASKKVVKQLLTLELFVIQNIAYFITAGMIYLILKDYIAIEYLKTLANFLRPQDYLILYVALLTLSGLITLKYSKELYKKTAISTYGEEV